MFQIPQMFLPKIFQIPQMFLPKMFQIPQMFGQTEEKSGKPNERFWHENALFLEKKVRKSAFSCHFKEKYRNFAVEPKH